MVEVRRHKERNTRYSSGAKDQGLSRNCFKKYIEGETESRCRLYKEYEETTDHLTSGYHILTKNEDIIKHDKHYLICKKLDFETA
jgi:hypothetical protein